jgi:hypothetical protein
VAEAGGTTRTRATHPAAGEAGMNANVDLQVVPMDTNSKTNMTSKSAAAEVVATQKPLCTGSNGDPHANPAPKTSPMAILTDAEDTATTPTDNGQADGHPVHDGRHTEAYRRPPYDTSRRGWGDATEVDGEPRPWDGEDDEPDEREEVTSQARRCTRQFRNGARKARSEAHPQMDIPEMGHGARREHHTKVARQTHERQT